ncbi:MAG: hypothetical protein KBF93_22055 [Leptospiraceae bacterium]|nr:hypothetical protein [Leptospiraceae bacterium]
MHNNRPAANEHKPNSFVVMLNSFKTNTPNGDRIIKSGTMVNWRNASNAITKI